MAKEEINQALKESNLDVDAMISNIREINKTMTTEQPKVNIVDINKTKNEIELEKHRNLNQIAKNTKKSIWRDLLMALIGALISFAVQFIFLLF